MRYKIGETGKNGRDESWYFVEYEPEKGKAYWVHEWSNLSYSLKTDAGQKRVPLEDAAKERFYDEALLKMQANHPEWQPVRG